MSPEDSVIQQEVEDYWYGQGEAVAKEMMEEWNETKKLEDGTYVYEHYVKGDKE